MLRVALAQVNATVGDLEGNVERVLAAYDEAARAGADLVAFPELVVTGYPPEDLLLRPAFVSAAGEALEKIAARTGRVVAVVGYPERRDGGPLANSAAVCSDGVIRGVYRKNLLPNYAVFDEQRYFSPSMEEGPLFLIDGVRVAVSICEDIWSLTGPAISQARQGADVIVNINASPYYAGRLSEREAMLSGRATQIGIPILYVNAVGGQDELVFDGGSMVFDASGALLARAPQFTESLLAVDLEIEPNPRPSTLPVVAVVGRRTHPSRDAQGPPCPPHIDPVPAPDREVYEALVLGTRDYVTKNGFSDVIIGLSGGIDSSLVAAVAVDALGAEHVTGVLMPSRFSSEGSLTDAARLVENLGIQSITVPIESAHASLEAMLVEPFTVLSAGADVAAGVAEENLQARIRGTILMALSNKFGRIVLTTGNKSEMATGYATLYGDMAGGFAVIKDVEKTLVYRLAQDRNARAGRDLIPQAVLTKPPSAELRPDQRDDDSLPPYEQLDQILEGYVERDLSASALAEAGFDLATAREVARLVDRSEYKRRQAPPGPRVSPKAFGKDRRLPITNCWHD